MSTAPRGGELVVKLYGTPVALVSRGRSAHRLRWQWTAEPARRWGAGARLISHGIPFGAAGSELSDLRAGVFADGLLPEGEARNHYAVNAGIDPDDTWGLLRRYGRDTAGALEFVPTEPQDEPGEPPAELSAAHLRALLEEAGSHRREGGLTSVSLAGLVPKVALVRTTSGWRRPALGEPSTWIVKVAHPDDSQAADVVDTEAACLDLGRRVGVTTVKGEVVVIDGLRAIAVSRYDRVALPDGAVGRIHQEDLAQALGINTAEPERKFQRGRVIPSWVAAADVLRAGGAPLSPLARLVTFSWLVGNTDHHAKNTSFLRYDDARVALAPAYDIAAHLHHPGRHRTALDLAGESWCDRLTVEHVVSEIASWGVPEGAARQVVAQVAEAVTGALATIDRAQHPGVSAEAWAVLESRSREAKDALRPVSC